MVGVCSGVTALLIVVGSWVRGHWGCQGQLALLVAWVYRHMCDTCRFKRYHMMYMDSWYVGQWTVILKSN